MKLRTFVFLGLVLAALVGLSGAANCLHAETFDHAAALEMQGHSDGVPSCHHNRTASYQTSVAWVRPAQNFSAAAFLPVKLQFASIDQSLSSGQILLRARDLSPMGTPRYGANVGFDQVFASNGRLLI